MEVGMLLISIYSPQSGYFMGPTINYYPSENLCMEAAKKSIGEKLPVFAWDTYMQGTVPKVIASYCVSGFAAESIQK